jgi:hypothetical protein
MCCWNQFEILYGGFLHLGSSRKLACDYLSFVIAVVVLLSGLDIRVIWIYRMGLVMFFPFCFLE